MVDFMAVTLFFVAVLAVIKTYHQHRMKKLELEGGGASAQSIQQLQHAEQRVHYLTAVNTQMEERVRNLETIVCSVDFELNAKLNRLASQQLLKQASPVSAEEAAETQALSVGNIKPGGRVAGRFVVERLLGSGGMGAVYLARDEQLGEVVALKVIAGSALLDPAAADRFRREASAARRISHSNVVRIHDIGEEQGVLFMSMEYIAGESMSSLLERHGTLPVAQLRSIVAQVCAGLAAAHEAGVVHRDLKPGNILIDGSNVKIIDFGLARLAHIEGMTATGMILGTPEYMAPEQIRGKPVDPRTDIYALGAVIYHALAGRPPYSGDSPIAIGFKHCNEQLVPPVQVKADVPLAWSQLVERAMAKDPSHRFAGSAELLAELPST
jgi:serine/threonine-protein kinase